MSKTPNLFTAKDVTPLKNAAGSVISVKEEEFVHINLLEPTKSVSLCKKKCTKRCYLTTKTRMPTTRLIGRLTLTCLNLVSDGSSYGQGQCKPKMDTSMSNCALDHTSAIMPGRAC